MADYTRTQLYPDNRSRVRAQITCPRCRVDPSHISRQYWCESSLSTTTRPLPQPVEAEPSAAATPQTNNNSVVVNNNNNNNNNLVTNNPSVERVTGYPDLCPRFSNYNNECRPPVPPVQHTPRGASSSSFSYYHSGPVRSSDNHSTRSAGETWRIRGVFENPDITRRAESNPGPLPDVTRHSAVSASPANLSSIQHTRIPSTCSTYESQLPPPPPQRNVPPNCSIPRYPPDTRCRTASSSFREPQNLSIHRSEMSSSERRSAPPQWKREQQQPCRPSSSTANSSNNNPWVTRSQPERAQLYTSGNSPSNGNNGGNIQPQQAPSTSCWRSSSLSAPQHVLSQCPLPDLVTPRRQARKQCCGLLATHSVAVRWLVIVVASLGLLCSVVGTVVGVVKASGKEHLSIALLLIGLGIVLVSMSGVAWRLTSRDAPSCGAMFGFRRGARSEPHRRFVPRVPHYGRPHPFSAMLYPDIPLRPPPPSYQASMQEYRLRLLLMDRPQMPSPLPPPPPPPPQHPPPPPPPTYRGPATVYSRFPLGPSDYSRPPSYRSRPPSSVGQPSPVSTDDLELTPQLTASEHFNVSGVSTSEVNCPTLGVRASSSGIQRLAPSAGGGINQVEVVAQV